MAEIILIENTEGEIHKTNYWQTELARGGKFYVSTNAGVFRLLVPPQHVGMVREVRTAECCVVRRGPYPKMGFTDGVEILFDDHSPDPYSLHLSWQSLDRMPLDTDSGKEWKLSVWTHRVGESATKRQEWPCYYRRVRMLPDLRPWS